VNPAADTILATEIPTDDMPSRVNCYTKHKHDSLFAV
jgi:hypothetical protein